MTLPCAIFTDLTSREDYITDLLLFNHLHYIVISTCYGNIRIYKWDSKNRTKKYIHTLKGHTRAITSLFAIPPRKTYKTQNNNKAWFSKETMEQSTVVSAGVDGTIRIWCLEKLIELYSFDLHNQGLGYQGEIMHVQLLSDKIFSVFAKDHVNRVDVGQISHLATSYFISKSQISHMQKAFSNQNAVFANRTESLMVSFDNNSMLLLWPEDGTVKSTIYPPPTPTAIQHLVFCMALNRVFLLLGSGSLCVYKVHNRETATLDKLIHYKDFKDYEDKKLSQQITTMTLVSIKPPCTDCEIFGTHKYKFKTEQEDESDSDQSLTQDLDELDAPSIKDELKTEYAKQLALRKNDEYLVAGLESGTIIFIYVR